MSNPTSTELSNSSNKSDTQSMQNPSYDLYSKQITKLFSHYKQATQALLVDLLCNIAKNTDNFQSLDLNRTSAHLSDSGSTEDIFRGQIEYDLQSLQSGKIIDLNQKIKASLAGLAQHMTSKIAKPKKDADLDGKTEKQIKDKCEDLDQKQQEQNSLAPLPSKPQELQKITEILQKLVETQQDLLKIAKLQPQDPKKAATQKFSAATMTVKNRALYELISHSISTDLFNIMHSIQRDVTLTAQQKLHINASIQNEVHQLEYFFLNHYSQFNAEAENLRLNTATITTFNTKIPSIWQGLFNKKISADKPFEVSGQGQFAQIEIMAHNNMLQIIDQILCYDKKLCDELKSLLVQKMMFDKCDFAEKSAQYNNIQRSIMSRSSQSQTFAHINMALDKFVGHSDKFRYTNMSDQEQNALELFIHPASLKQLRVDVSDRVKAVRLKKISILSSYARYVSLKAQTRSITKATLYAFAHASISVAPLSYKLKHIPFYSNFIAQHQHKALALTIMLFASTAAANYLFSRLITDNGTGTINKQFQSLKPGSDDSNPLSHVLSQLYTNSLAVSHMNLANSFAVAQSVYNQSLATSFGPEMLYLQKQRTARYGALITNRKAVNLITRHAELLATNVHNEDIDNAKQFVIG